MPDPTSSKLQAASASEETLTWIEGQVATIYSKSRESTQESAPYWPNLRTYMDIYTAVHDYCTGAARTHKGAHLLGEDVYRRIEQQIRTHCQAIRTDILSIDQTPAEGLQESRRTISECVSQWTKFLHVSSWMSNLLRFLDRHWVKRELDDKKNESQKRDIYPIYDLHLVVWAQEVLQVDELPKAIQTTWLNELNSPNEILKAAVKVREEGRPLDEEILEDFIKTLEVISLASANIGADSVE